MKVDKFGLECIDNCVTILEGDIHEMFRDMDMSIAMDNMTDDPDRTVLVDKDTSGVVVTLVEELSDGDATPGMHCEDVLVNRLQLENAQSLNDDVMGACRSMQPGDSVSDETLAKAVLLLEILNTPQA